MIIFTIMIALFNGFLVVLSRLLNARLGREINPVGASIWNHLTGALLMSVVYVSISSQHFNFENIPFHAFLGGVIGAVYVTISNYIIPKVGASKAVILMIAGQIFIATLIDYFRNIVGSPLIALIGILLIILGVYSGEKGKEL